MKRYTGGLLMVVGVGAILRAIFKMVSPLWALLIGGFILYVMGYNLYHNGKRVDEVMAEVQPNITPTEGLTTRRRYHN